MKTTRVCSSRLFKAKNGTALKRGDKLYATPSAKQEPVAQLIKCHNMRGDTWFDLKMFRRDHRGWHKTLRLPSIRNERGQQGCPGIRGMS
jgi:hypothetical protein